MIRKFIDEKYPSLDGELFYILQDVYNKGLDDAMDVCDNAWNDVYSAGNLNEHAMGIKSVISKLKEIDND